MARPLIGQLLRSMGKLNSIDVEEILTEQSITHRRFGEIAIDWGLVNPQNVCDAWCAQFKDESGGMDLSAASPDARALACLSPEIVRRLGIVPVRIIGNDLVVAASQPLDAGEINEITRQAGRHVRIVRAESSQVECLIRQHYATAQAAA